ncbi:MAG: peroxiredoxin [Polyangiaceae bacterium]|nr:peroxiredoxin [Polyangiaceae bacterium]
MTLSVGDRAPDFTLPSESGEPVTLSSLLGQAPLVVYFYPKDDSPGCTREACSFRDRYDAFAEAGARVVGVSSDSVESHRRFADKHRLPMTLLSDRDGKVRALYGVRATLGILPGRATFVIDASGVVRHIFVSQLRFLRHVDEALSVVRALASSKAGAPLAC